MGLEKGARSETIGVYACATYRAEGYDVFPCLDYCMMLAMVHVRNSGYYRLTERPSVLFVRSVLQKEPPSRLEYEVTLERSKSLVLGSQCVI